MKTKYKIAIAVSLLLLGIVMMFYHFNPININLVSATDLKEIQLLSRMLPVGLSKQYISINKEAIIKNIYDNELATYQLIYNTKSCGGNLGDCFAIIKLNLPSPQSNLLSNLRFEDLKNNNQDTYLDYNIQIKSLDGIYEDYDSNNVYDSGDYYIKITGYKQESEVVDWIPEVLGSLEITDWAVWGSQYTYDDFNDASVNSTLWDVITSGSTTGTVTESSGNIRVYVQGTATNGYVWLNSKLFPDYRTIKNITMYVNLSCQDWGSLSSANNIARILLLGDNDVNTIHCTGGDAYENDSVYYIIRNYTNNKLDIYYNTTKFMQITPTNNNITFFIGINSPSSAMSNIYVDYVYYVIDNSSLNITLNSPNNSINNYYSNNVTFNITSIAYINNLKNITLYLNNVSNQTLTLSGTNQLVSFNKSLAVGIYLWKVYVCDYSDNCKFSDERTIYSIPFIENNITYNQTTYESNNETFILNLTTASYSSSSFIYNGSSYSVSPTIVDSNYIFTKSVNVPINTLNNSFYWVINGYNSTINYQYVTPITFGLCNSTLNISYINFSFKDENNNSYISAKMDTATFNYGTGLDKTLTVSNTTNNTNYEFCYNLPSKTLNYNVSFQYSNTGYPQRTFYSSGTLTNTTTNEILYLLGNGDGIYSTYIVTTQANVPLQGVSVQIERQFNGVWTLLTQGTTDSAGSVTFFLNNNYQHRITTTKSGYSQTQVTITPSQSVYTIIMSGTGTTYSTVTNIEGLNWLIFPAVGIVTNTTNNFGFNITSSKANLVSCRIDLSYINNTVITSSSNSALNTSYCSVLVSYNLNTSKIKGILYVDIGNGTQVLEGDAFWINEQINTTGMTISDFFKDMTNFNLSYFGNDETHREYTMIVLFFIAVMIICAFLSIMGWDLQTGGGIILVVGVLIWIASFPGFLILSGISPFVFIDKFFVAISYSLFVGGYLFRNFT